jgi:hypothetical protein
MSDEIISEERWSYVLFSRKGEWLLTFLSGGPVEVDHTVRLSYDEIQKLRSGTLAASALILRLKSDPESYSSRELQPPIWPQEMDTRK